VSKEPKGPIPFDARRVNVLRGKSLMYGIGDAGREIRELCFMLDWFEQRLDDEAGDCFGTEGWRKGLGAKEV
jgi:hypothetical protein